jgi:RNA polymerase sigma-70 factor (ECF subfamily)
MDLEQDAELHAAFRRGDPEVLAQVYLHYQPLVRNMLTKGFAFASRGRLVRSHGIARADVEDIVQEVFARAFSHAARRAYDGVRPYRSYLFAITRNFVVQLARTTRAQPLPFDERALATELVALAPSPERLLEAHRQSVDLRGFLAGLDADERRFFALRFAHQYSVERVAEALGWSIYRVKLTDRRLRQRMLRRFA